MKLICGVVAFDGRALPAEMVQPMMDAMTAPGQQPVRAVWTSSHAVLATLNFSRHRGPATLPVSSSGALLAADARLYRTQFGSGEPALQADASDDDVLGAAIVRWGAGAFNQVDGDFACASWNAAKHELLLGRDAMGVRPLVYHQQPGHFVVFASFPRGVHASGLLTRRIDPVSAVRDALQISQKKETIFAGLQEVMPGTSLTFTAASATERIYWQPRLDRLKFGSFVEAAAALREAVVLATEDRLGTTGDVAAHLSGGLDSSALAVIAVRKLRQGGRRLLGYSFLEPPEAKMQDDDETPFVQAVLQQEPDIQWTAISASSREADEATFKMDRMLSDDPLDPENQICADAAAHGVEVALSGWGGDEASTFNGRGSLATAFTGMRWLYLLQQVQMLKRVRGFRRRHTLRGEVFGYLAPALFAKLRALAGRAPLGLAEQKTIFRAEVEREARQGGEKPLTITGDTRANQLELIRGRHIAMRTGNWAEIGAPYGIAFTFPLLDRRVIDVALSMRATWHLRDGLRRSPFREAMKGILPELVRMRHGKITPFPSSMFHLAARRDSIRSRCQELLADATVQAVFDEALSRAALDRMPNLEELQANDARAMDLLIPLPLAGLGEMLKRG